MKDYIRINSMAEAAEGVIDAGRMTPKKVKHAIGEMAQAKLVAGANITIDDTDPAAPVISATGGGGGGAVDSVNGKTGVVTGLEWQLTAGTNVSIDRTNPEAPVISASGGSIAVESNGVPVVPSVSALNFTGGVTVTDGGGGEAVINVAAGGGFGLATRASGGIFTVPNTANVWQPISPFNNIDYDPLGFFPSSASEIRFPADGWYQIIFTAQVDGSDPFANNLFRFFASSGVVIYVASQVVTAGYNNPGVLLDTGAFFATEGATAQLNAATSATGAFAQASCRMTVKRLG